MIESYVNTVSIMFIFKKYRVFKRFFLGSAESILLVGPRTDGRKMWKKVSRQ